MYTRNYRIARDEGRRYQQRQERAEMPLQPEDSSGASELACAEAENASEKECEGGSFADAGAMESDNALGEAPNEGEMNVTAEADNDKGKSGENRVKARAVRSFRVRERGSGEALPVGAQARSGTMQSESEGEGGAETVKKRACPRAGSALRGFSSEDMFLISVMLLLLNEGCEDVLILILGFILLI